MRGGKSDLIIILGILTYWNLFLNLFLKTFCAFVSKNNNKYMRYFNQLLYKIYVYGDNLLNNSSCKIYKKMYLIFSKHRCVCVHTIKLLFIYFNLINASF